MNENEIRLVYAAILESITSEEFFRALVEKINRLVPPKHADNKPCTPCPKCKSGVLVTTESRVCSDCDYFEI